ncbi:putative transcriptional regulator NRG2 [Colletotrichum sidae]|uniref:Putative transcriptional regulator NRG2 n=2 Tax=Colletotrichum orbiculare species complex TaxID=2707354 RepID=A0A4R8QKH1_9PEZI|nr:putative transcriptional regulator NRG2 [Colletotrichum spinosum]TEA16543.1 putative transcriptional regulator NRG2 [Colletotrichum sidae]
MHVRDATGRQVSLLNDDEPTAQPMPQRLSYRTASQIISQPYHPANRSSSSSPLTPELLRSDSYDSNASSDPLSPLTPTSFEPRNAFAPGQPMYEEYDMPSKRPPFTNTSRANSYEEDSSPTSPQPERAGKRYPCRYRESHGCEKTFTTSGHASRHSKIHTAEKAVQCVHAGCQKKFTRADNMKQHLETHYKDKSRSTASAKAAARSSLGALSATGRRSSSSSSRTLPTTRASRDQPMWDAESYGYPPGQAPLPSPSANGAWDMRGFNLPVIGRPSASRPSAARTPSGLDTLVLAVACQEGV